MSAAPRTALWGGRDGEGGRRRRRERERERGGPAEGRGLRESGGGAGGGEPETRPGLGSPQGWRRRRAGRARVQGWGAPSPSVVGIIVCPPPPPRLTRHLGGGRRRGGPGVGARGGGRGRGYAPGLVAVARKQWGGGSRWEDGAHTPALRRAGGRAPGAGGRAGHPTPPPRREGVGAARRGPELACRERVLRAGRPTPGSGARTPASSGSRAPPSRRSRQAPGLRAAGLRPPGGRAGKGAGRSPRCSRGGEAGDEQARACHRPTARAFLFLNPSQSSPASEHRQGAMRESPPPPLHPCLRSCFASPQE